MSGSTGKGGMSCHFDRIFTDLDREQILGTQGLHDPHLYLERVSPPV